MKPRISGTWRFSTIMSTTKDRTEFFDTLDDMPAVLRAECVRTLQSKDAATILISDAAGRRYLREALSQHYQELEPSAQPSGAGQLGPWVEVLACGALGLFAWVLTKLF